MDINLTIAQNVKNAREQRKLTLDAAAQVTGVSRSMLTQIEKGDVNPTISVLWKIANGYKVSFTSLVENNQYHATLIPASSICPVTEDDGRYVNYPTFTFDEKKLFEMYRIEIAPQGFLEALPHLTDSEEYITVFAGTVEVQLEKETFQLNTGDSLRFQADQKHSYKNLGQTQALLSMLIYYAK